MTKKRPLIYRKFDGNSNSSCNAYMTAKMERLVQIIIPGIAGVIVIVVNPIMTVTWML